MLNTEAQHWTGTILEIGRRPDLCSLKLLRDSGYTHIRTVGWGWEKIDVAIDAATPHSKLPVGKYW